MQKDIEIATLKHKHDLFGKFRDEKIQELAKELNVSRGHDYKFFKEEVSARVFVILDTFDEQNNIEKALEKLNRQETAQAPQ